MSNIDQEEEEEHDASSVFNLEGIKVEECKVGRYKCPQFVMSKYEEKCIHRPQKRGVIVKLLGRKI